jgi:hypothetical protein
LLGTESLSSDLVSSFAFEIDTSEATPKIATKTASLRLEFMFGLVLDGLDRFSFNVSEFSELNTKIAIFRLDWIILNLSSD